MKKPSLAFACLLLLAWCLSPLVAQDEQAWYVGKPISAIEFKGLKSVDKRDLDGIAKPYLKKPFSNDLFLELQSALYDLDEFESIEPSAVPADAAGSSVIIQFVMKEKPVVSSVTFEGYSAVKPFELEGKVTVKQGDVANKTVIAADEAALLSLYREKGYTDATVTSEERDTPKGVNVVFVISEGRMIAVKKIAFSGNAAFSEKTLLSVMALKQIGPFQSGAFQEEKLASSRQALQDYYLDRGFVDAKVLDVQRSYEKDAKKARDLVTLTFVVSEGKQYIYQGTTFEGNAVFSTEKLSSLIWQKKGQPFNKSKFSADFDRVRNLYYEEGYVFNQIEPSFSKDDSALTMTVSIKITEREKAHISSITLKGNEKTKDYVIRREIPLQEGDVFSKKKIEEGLRNLANLQYFSSIVPDVVPLSEQLVDLTLNLTEQSTAGFNIGFTYIPSSSTSSFPIGGFLKWNDSNFMGQGQNFSTDLEVTNTQQSITTSFSDPWLMGVRLLGGVNLSLSRTMTSIAQDIEGPVFSDGVPDPYTSLAQYVAANYKVPSEYLMTYDSYKLDLGESTGYLFKLGAGDLGVKLGADTTLEDIYYDSSVYRPYSADIRDNLGKWQLQNYFTFYTYLDGLDLSYNPSKGYVLTNKITLEGLFPAPTETQQFIRDDFKAQFFATLFNVPVSENWRFKGVLGLSTSYTAMLAKPGMDLAVKTGNWPVVDGMMTMRGWSDLASFDATGIFYNWVELRLPIFEQYLWLDAFLDAAAVQTESGLLSMSQDGASVSEGKNMLNLGIGNMAFSTGLMFRVTLPNFPLRIGIAKKFVAGSSGILPVSGDLFHSSSDPNSGFALILSLTQSAY